MDYIKLVNKITPRENKIKNMFYAFTSGGVIGLISEIISSIFSVDIMIIFMITTASLLTGIGVFDNFVNKFKMGMIIPITGFAHSVSASALEYKNDGLITGIGSNVFKLAGSVILYGIISSSILIIIRGLIWLV